MMAKIRDKLAQILRGIVRSAKSILTAPLRLLRLILNIPLLVWRGFVGLVQFLIALPGRVWRGLTGLVRFLIALPGRAGRALVRAWRRLIVAVRLWIRASRARFSRWLWSKVLRPRTLSLKAQGWLLLTGVAGLCTLVLIGAQLRRRAGAETVTVIVTATPATENQAQINLITPTPINPRPGATSESAQGGAFGGGGVVVFSMSRDGNADIYARKLSDDQLLRLTYHAAEDRDPAWAPDGETLAFASNRSNNWDIYRLDLVSGVLIRLTRGAHYDAHPSWSPDGAFIAFESYANGNLDIFIMASNGSQIQQLTSNPAADFAPAWSTDGRHIAFVSYRDGSKDIYLYPLDAGTETAVINLTQTPDRDENAPAWSADGRRLAFSVGRFGAETIYVTTFDWSSKFLDEAQTQLFNPGSDPAWSPDGTSLIFEYWRAGQAYLIADTATGWGAGQEIFSADLQIQEPSWSMLFVDPELLARQRQSALTASALLYLEEISPPPASGPPYTIVALKDVNGGDDREFLSDRVNDSFQALRQRVLDESGIDYLSNIGDSFRRLDVPPPPGQSPRNWHKAGRAFDLNQGLYEREEQLVELVREDIGFRTYWRVYLRAAQQDGSQGRPLLQAPWNLKARQEGGLAAREGGEQTQTVPRGYYVDFTQLAADYGWERVPANQGWREQWADINWWQYQKSQGLSWLDAMTELYRLDEIEAVFGPLPEEDG